MGGDTVIRLPLELDLLHRPLLVTTPVDMQQRDLEQLRVRLGDAGPDAPEGVGIEVLEVVVVAR